MNVSGTLLAIVGEKRLFACMLPSPGFMSRAEEVINVKYVLFSSIEGC